MIGGPGMEARVVPRAEQVRAPEAGRQVLPQRARRRHEQLVVAPAVGLEPVAVVVVLQLAQEVERLGREALKGGHAYGITTGAIVTGLWTV